MKLLIDTNILIPLEPTGRADLHTNTAAAGALAQVAMAGGHQLYVHPAIADDIARDRNQERRELRSALLAKYLRLDHPPPSAKVDSVLGTPTRDSHDYVDHQLLAALHANAVDYLVTEDGDISRKAKRLGIDQRVFTIAAATSLLRSLFDVSPPPPPAVTETLAHSLNRSDPIFASFRADYPDFDDWLERCQREQRLTWVVQMGDRHAALAIVKEEKNEAELVGGKTLKICSLKVSDDFRGFRFGELVLKAVFGYAESNRYAGVFVTVLPKYEELIDLLGDFGFTDTGKRTKLGELVLAKRFSPDAAVADPLTYNILYGPSAILPDEQHAYMIPIQPGFSDFLFPETAAMQPLFPGRFAFGNGIRKAYLSNASIRTIDVGSTLFFYRSQRAQGVIAVGVLERCVVSSDPDVIAREVARRTVYTFAEMADLAARGEILALLFRQARVLVPSPLSRYTRTQLSKVASTSNSEKRDFVGLSRTWRSTPARRSSASSPSFASWTVSMPHRHTFGNGIMPSVRFPATISGVTTLTSSVASLSTSPMCCRWRYRYDSMYFGCARHRVSGISLRLRLRD